MAQSVACSLEPHTEIVTRDCRIRLSYEWKISVYCSVFKKEVNFYTNKKMFDEARIALKHYENLPYVSQEVDTDLHVHIFTGCSDFGSQNCIVLS